MVLHGHAPPDDHLTGELKKDMPNWKAWAANFVAPGSGFLVKMADKFKKKPVAAAAAGAVGGAAVAAAVRPAPAAPMMASYGGSDFGSTFKSKAGKGLLILLLSITLYYVLLRLGVNWPFDLSLIVGLGFLAMFAIWWPEQVEKIFKFIAAGFGFFIIFVMSALLFARIPWMPHLFVIGFLFLAVFVSFQIAGRKWGWIIFMINLLFYVPLMATPMYQTLFVPGTPFYTAVEGQQQAWGVMFGGIGEVGSQIGKIAKEQVLIASGDYEQGVEAESERPLGVFLDDVGAVAQIVKENEVIDVYARLRAESFKTVEPVRISVRCYVEDWAEKLTGEIRPRSQFSVEEYELQDLDCIMSAKPVFDNTGGSANIIIETSFNFTTSSYLKGYFMEQDRIRALRRQQLDPLDAFGITDKNPLAVYTGGPLKIGLGVGQQPIALLSEEEEIQILGETNPPTAALVSEITGAQTVGDGTFGPTLTITLDRNWFEGELFEVGKLIITVPPGMSIDSVSGEKISCPVQAGKEHTCTLSGDLLKKLFTSPVVLPKTIRVQTKINDPDVLLANAPLAIRSFKLTVTYKYIVKKEVSVTVRPAESKV